MCNDPVLVGQQYAKEQGGQRAQPGQRSEDGPAPGRTGTDVQGRGHSGDGNHHDAPGREPAWAQYSPLITKKEPRITPASRDFWRANLKPADASSSGISMPSESLNPTARFPS